MNLVDSKNIDDKNTGHIKASIQNIILRFGKINEENTLTEAEEIAHIASYNNPNGLQTTQSNVYCPLIWIALKKSNINIPEKWSQTNIIILEELAEKLSKINGWSDYCLDVLINNNFIFSDNDNDFFSENVINQSNYHTNKINLLIVIT